MMNADWPERPGIRVKHRKQITPDEQVPLELSDRERELIALKYGAAINNTPDLDLPDPKSVPVELPLPWRCCCWTQA